MRKKRCIIVGGGIAGLSLAWYLGKNALNDVLLLEKEPRLGGCIDTVQHDGFLFEAGPRIFKTARSQALLELISEMGLTPSTIPAQKRYVWRKQKLRKLPEWGTLLGAALEWRKPVVSDDESIWDFALRRFGKKIAERVFDPMTIGVYAGNPRSLSISACFPLLKAWEKQHGSVTRGFLKAKKGSNAFFSLQGGMKTLIQALQEKCRVCHEEVMRISETYVETKQARWEYDELFLALPAHVAKQLLQEHVDFPTISMRGLRLVHFGFRDPVVCLPGFGYLVPSMEQEDVLGTVFDSNFSSSCSTCLTVMLKEGTPVEHAHAALKSHLKIEKSPDFFHVTERPASIPQFTVGHQVRIEALQRALTEKLPRIHLVGNYLSGVSVSDVVELSKSRAMPFFKSFLR